MTQVMRWKRGRLIMLLVVNLLKTVDQRLSSETRIFHVKHSVQSQSLGEDRAIAPGKERVRLSSW
jgi:hypothetical protein